MSREKVCSPFYSYACLLFNKYNMEDSNASEIKKINPGSLTRPWTSVHAHLSNLLIYVCSTRVHVQNIIIFPMLFIVLDMLLKLRSPPMNNIQNSPKSRIFRIHRYNILLVQSR